MPMAGLRQEMAKIGFENVKTLLNSGNVIFDGSAKRETNLEEEIATHLVQVFGFAIPVLVRKAEEIIELIKANPFSNIAVTRDIRLYVSFLKETPEENVTLPWISEDKSFRIIAVRNRIVCSVLDLSATKTPTGMDFLEKLFGKNITTRNWNTLIRIGNKLIE